MEQDVGILEDIAGERAAKRPRITREEPDSDEEVEHILYVRWHGNAGQTKLNKLALKRLEGDKVESLKVSEVSTYRALCMPWVANQGTHRAWPSSCQLLCFCCLTLLRHTCLRILQDLPKELIDSQYPSTSEFPDYFTNSAYIRFTPHVEALALPGEQQGNCCTAFQRQHTATGQQQAA